MEIVEQLVCFSVSLYPKIWTIRGYIYSKACDLLRDEIQIEANEISWIVYRTGETFAGKVILKVGVMDDPEWPNDNVPKVELFEGHRAQWQKPVDGAASIPGMP